MNISLNARVYVNGQLKRGWGTIVGMAASPSLIRSSEPKIVEYFRGKTDRPYPQVYVRMEGDKSLMHYNSDDIANGKLMETEPVRVTATTTPAPAPTVVAVGDHALDFGVVPTAEDTCGCTGPCILSSNWVAYADGDGEGFHIVLDDSDVAAVAALDDDMIRVPATFVMFVVDQLKEFKAAAAAPSPVAAPDTDNMPPRQLMELLIALMGR